jgi:phospho-N-acetylmuramoyl-pentapeptide-transferase
MNNTLHLTISIHILTKILTLAVVSFLLSMAITPLYTTYAYKHSWWKRQRTDAWSGGKATVYQKLHAAKHKRNIPTMAGLIFVLAIVITTFCGDINRGQTWLPIAGMIGAGAIGLVDDIMNVRSNGGIAGMPARVKFALYSIVILIGGWWFYAKLDVHSIYLPLIHQWHIGVFVIALFWLVVMATANSVNITDGLDGLAGGLLTSSFATYAIIAIVEHKFALAGFCLIVVGSLLSYTWFNIYPARFMMGDVGAFALGTALGIVAMQTDTLYVLPIIGFVYVVETG